MGLAKKGTSRIHVDGIDYRWVVSGNDDFLDLLVEPFDGSGSRLAIQMEHEFGEITPKLVAEIIRLALTSGLELSKHGGLPYVRLMDDKLVPISELLR